MTTLIYLSKVSGTTPGTALRGSGDRPVRVCVGVRGVSMYGASCVCTRTQRQRNEISKDLSTSCAGFIVHRRSFTALHSISKKCDLYRYLIKCRKSSHLYTHHTKCSTATDGGPPLPCCLELPFSQLWAAPPTWPLPGCGTSLRCRRSRLSTPEQCTAPPPARSARPPP